MGKRCFWIVLSLLLYIGITSAQSVDTLEQKLKTLNDTNKVLYLIDIVKKNQKDAYKATIYLEKATPYLEKTRPYYEVGRGEVLEQKASISFFQADYKNTLESALSARTIYEKHNRILKVAHIDNILGITYLSLRFYIKSKESLLRVIAVGKQFKDTLLYYKGCVNLSNTYLRMGLLDSALFQEKQLLNLLTKNPKKNEPALIPVYNTMANIYFEQKKYDIALDYYKKTLFIARKRNDGYALMNIYLGFGKTYLQLRKYEISTSYADSALTLAKDNGYNLGKMISYQLLSELYETKKDFAKSADYLKLIIAAQDTIFNQQIMVSNEKVVQSIEIQLKEREKQQLLETQMKQQKKLYTINTVVLLVLFLLIAAILTILVVSKQRTTLRKLNQQLGKQHTLIREQNEDYQLKDEILRQTNDTLEKTVLDRTKTLQKTNEELDRFLYCSAHDLRRPLTSLLGLVQLASYSNEVEEYKSLMEKVGATAQQMDALLQKLIALENIQSASQKESTFLLPLLTQILAELNLSYTQVQHNFSETLHIETFSHPLYLVFHNILENAVVFSKPHEPLHIHIHYEHSTTEHTLTFKDNGVGIEPAYQSRVFDMYFNAHEQTKGSGLGLYVVQKAMDKIGGSIRVSSTPEVGSSFTLTLPIVENKTTS